VTSPLTQQALAKTPIQNTVIDTTNIGPIQLELER